MTTPSPTAGRVIAGKYRLESLLGKGGMGEVWRATQLNLQSTVAIKLITHQQMGSANALVRLLREAQSTAQLRSPHVVQIFDHGEEDGSAFIVMELLMGMSLDEYLKGGHVRGYDDVLTIMTHVARAIGRAHEAGVVHRDLKPSNIFVIDNDGDLLVKVLDFGIAKATVETGEPTPITKPGSVLGTPHYMSPEQIEHPESIDHRCDLWAMGVIVFECLCGARPFAGGSIGELLLNICVRDQPVPSQTAPVPAGFDDWFMKATHRDIGTRFQSTHALLEALQPVLSANAKAASPSGASANEELSDAMATLPIRNSTKLPQSLEAVLKAAPPATSSWPKVIAGLAAAGVVATVALMATSMLDSPSRPDAGSKAQAAPTAEEPAAAAASGPAASAAQTAASASASRASARPDSSVTAPAPSAQAAPTNKPSQRFQPGRARPRKTPASTTGPANKSAPAPNKRGEALSGADDNPFGF